MRNKRISFKRQKPKQNNLRDKGIRHPLFRRKEVDGFYRVVTRQPVLRTPSRGHKLYEVTKRKKRARLICKHSRISLFPKKPRNSPIKIHPKHSSFVFQPPLREFQPTTKLYHAAYTPATQTFDRINSTLFQRTHGASADGKKTPHFYST